MKKVAYSILTNDDGSPSVSELALEIAKEFEKGPEGGHARYVYICPTGQPTIGWGHVVLKGEKFNEPMTREEADELLLKDMNKTAAQVYRLLRREPTQDQFDAMVSMAFNTGVGKADGIKGDFADSTLLSYYEQGKDQLAAAEFGKWVYGRVNGKMVALAGLVRRRKAEASLYLTGTFTL